MSGGSAWSFEFHTSWETKCPPCGIRGKQSKLGEKKQNAQLFKVDFEEAYDNIKWHCLLDA